MMAIYDWDGDSSTPPADVFDAHGVYHPRVCWVDTETGEMEKVALFFCGREGKKVRPYTDADGNIVKARFKVPAPVTVKLSNRVEPVKPRRKS